MAFRFVHTADIHLDSPLRSLALRNPELAELVGDASRQAFLRHEPGLAGDLSRLRPCCTPDRRQETRRTTILP
ncbi:hypothetical protein FJ414_23330 [Mesorhizobium sp. B3-1-6]|nr:hypothetical protein FJ414_23330 [Mesorhizobium sp. B3-1-6]